MGYGSWKSSDYSDYLKATNKVTTTSSYCFGDRSVVLDSLDDSFYSSAQSLFLSKTIDEALSPFNVMRECCNSEDHPNTKPVILALDVTGSMGSAAIEVAKKLNNIMTELYHRAESDLNLKDIEFMIMAIGDLAYDNYPIQISQFESDVRIAEQLDKVYFESGGGSNPFESYTAAWYMGLYHCKLDISENGGKGVIITIGDEELNPYLPKRQLGKVTGDVLQGDVETADLWKMVSSKYDVFHIHVDHNTGSNLMKDRALDSFKKYLSDQNVISSSLDDISDNIISIITGVFSDSFDRVSEGVESSGSSDISVNEAGNVFW